MLQEKEMQRKMDMEMGGWVTSSETESNTIGNQPQVSHERYWNLWANALALECIFSFPNHKIT